MDFCDNRTYDEYFQSPFNISQEVTAETLSLQKALYKHFIPILIVGCVVSVLLNSVLVIVGHTKTVNKSPILVLSLNLATTDCLASIFIATGLLVNSYLPVVLDVDMGSSQCALLIIEIFRLSAIISSAMHLLSLALVHYKGIVKPLHYRYVFLFNIAFNALQCNGFPNQRLTVSK